MPKKKEIILGVTGSIAAYKSCDIVSGLRKTGYNVTVVMTQKAQEFVSVLTFQTLSGNKVITDMFAPLEKTAYYNQWMGYVNSEGELILPSDKIKENSLTGLALPDEYKPVHTSLAQRADLILIAPATANIISKIAAGICDDILSCTITASKATTVFAPAMNNNMYENKIIQNNIKKLKDNNYKFIGPIKGHLCCGCNAIGHFSEAENIIKEIKEILK